MFQELKQQQRVIQDNAYNAQLQNPQLKQLLELVSMNLFGKPLGQLSSTERNALLIAGGTLNNTFASDLFGIDNGGLQWEAIHRGVTASPISLQVLNSNGVSNAGYSYGTGSVSAGVTNQLMNTLRRAAYTETGANNTINTRGLNGNQYAQVYGQMIRREGLNRAHVMGIDLTGDADTLEDTIDNLARSKRVSEGTIKRYRELQKAREAFEDERDDSDTDAEALAKVQASGKFDDEMMKDLRLQVGGSLRGFVVDKNFTDKIQKATREVAGNIKMLSDITGFKDFDDLQAAADSLAMGSLTAKNNITNVERRMREWKTIAQAQNRDIREVMLEQQDIVEVLGAAAGGKEFVAGSMVTQYQLSRAVGQRNYEQGYSLITGEEAAARETQHEMMAREHYSGASVAAKVLRDNKGTMEPEKEKAIRQKEQEFLKAIRSGDTDMAYQISQEMQYLAETVDRRAGSQEFKRAANAEETRRFSDFSREGELSNNVSRIASEMRVADDGKGNATYRTLNALQGKAGLNATITNVEDLLEASVRAFGSDGAAQAEFWGQLEDAMNSDEAEGKDGRRAKLKKIRADLLAKGYTEDQMAMFDRMIDTAEHTANFGAGSLDERIRSFREIGKTLRNEQTSDPTLAMEGFVAQRENERQRLDTLMKDMAKRSEAYQSGEGLQAVFAGLMGNGTVSTADIMHMMYEQSGEDSVADFTKENGGVVLGKMVDGKLKLGKGGVRALLKNNATLRNMVGVSDVEQFMSQYGSEEAAQEAVLSALHSKESLSVLNNELVALPADKVASYRERSERAFNTEKAKKLRAMYGDQAVLLDKQGVAYVKDADGDELYEYEDHDDLVEQMVDKGDEFDATRENIFKKAKEGDKDAIVARDAYVAELYDNLDDDAWDELWHSGEKDVEKVWEDARKQGTVGAIRNALKYQFGTAKASDFENEASLRAAGLIDEDGNWTSGKYAGEHYTEVMKDYNDSSKMFQAVEAADKANTGQEKTADAVTEIVGLLTQHFNQGIKVRMD